MKSVHMSIETQTEEEDVVSLIFLNEKIISLETSKIAPILYDRNKNLFDKINNRTKIEKATIYRREVTTKSRNLNRMRSGLERGGQFVEKEISRLIFDNNILYKQSRLKTKAGNKIDFFPDSLKVFDGKTVLDQENLTKDDVESSSILSDVQQIKVNLGSGIKCFLFNDYAIDRESLETLSYRVIFEVNTFFEEYVRFVLKQIDTSILFLQRMLNSIIASGHYSDKNLRFEEEYVDQIYASLGIDGVNSKIDISNDRIKSSEFGTASLAYYNGLLLLTPDVSSEVYTDLFMSIIPNAKSSPATISSKINKFLTLRDNISKIYALKSNSHSEYSKISYSKKNGTKKIEAITNNFSLEKDKIGYNIFTENQSGINEMSAQSYRDRFLAEQRKYYPRMESLDQSNSMTRTESKDFKNISNKSYFLTPSNLVYGNKKLTTSRGINNIDPQEIKKFRIAKSQKALKKQISRTAVNQSSYKLSENTMSNFNLTISTPKRGLIERSTNEKIDPLVDAKYYVGSNSYFVTSSPAEVSTIFKKIELKENKKIFDIVSSIIPKRFLKNKKAIKATSEIKLSNKNSNTRRLLVDKRIEFKKIPPQIKYMMTDSFHKAEQLDPIKNIEVSSIIEETQKNLYIIKALVGFEVDDDNIPNLKRPIYREISQDDIGSRIMIAKAHDYEIPELGIVKDTFLATIYNNLLLLGV